MRARRPVQCVDLRADAATVARGGFWAVVGDFGGPVRAWRFADVSRATPGADVAPPARAGAPWAASSGPRPHDWTTSLDRSSYVAAVERVRQAVRAGDVYQANVCRVLSAPLAGYAGREPSAQALSAVLAAGNPAPFAGGVHVPAGVGLPATWVVTASPELFLRLDDGVLTSAPIKGTASTPDGLTAKDRAENVMITDLVRNDLQRVCAPGTVEVSSLLDVEEHPGLVHLVSTVQGRLAPGVAAAPDLWARVLDATYPPGSVSGAPKSAALRLIADLEPVPRGPYCGVVGWIDADGGRAELAVGIRTFWWTADPPGAGAPGTGAPGTGTPGTLRFGTGAGITWGSDPAAEWEETELKARRLIALASAPGGTPD
ncbi:anthranilate synthase [Cellulomonas aerilata]|uniref:Anthranilate synthase n=1 Tax=Cellulomonas aerilata TaxID=515326 RepID=A0A512DAE0_9CELL|nr:anthranilate synthase [Cellulomonas aerilata]